MTPHIFPPHLKNREYSLAVYSKDHWECLRITESQTGRGWKGPLWVPSQIEWKVPSEITSTAKSQGKKITLILAGINFF